ncbi:MAG: twin-arginine translocation signal domain-containing protein, partial [Planctomycetota bacterium]
MASDSFPPLPSPTFFLCLRIVAMSNRATRRRFLQDAAALGASLAVAGSLPAAQKKQGANDRLNLGIIAVAGRGADN